MSISAITNLEEVQEAIFQRMTANPEEALRIWTSAQKRLQRRISELNKDGWTWDGKRIRAIAEKRTVESLDREQAMREATRESELIDEGLATLTPETMLAYAEGVGTLESDPLIAKMLHENGKLMSKSIAVAQGKKIEDLYDDAGWIPPSWYARGGGITPDVMASNLRFETASEMWTALASSIHTHRRSKEGYAKAEKAVREVEKAAKAQAKAEVKPWRDEMNAMQDDDWNPRESLVRDLAAFDAMLSTMPKEIRAQFGKGFAALARKGSEVGRGKVIKEKVDLMSKLLDELIQSKTGMSSNTLVAGNSSGADTKATATKQSVPDATGGYTEGISSLKKRLLAGGILSLCLLSLVWTEGYREQKVIGLTELVALCGAWTCAVWLWTESASRLFRRWWKRNGPP